MGHELLNLARLLLFSRRQGKASEHAVRLDAIVTVAGCFQGDGIGNASAVDGRRSDEPWPQEKDDLVDVELQIRHGDGPSMAL